MTRRQVLSAGCLAASLLALPACGRRAPGNNGKRVGIVLTEGLAGLALQELATAQGFFREFDIEPQVLLVSDGSKCVAALVSGASQICLCSGFNQVTPAIAKGAPLKILAGGLTLSSLAMYSSRPDIQRVAALAGKVIGIGAPGSVLQQMTVLLLRKKGMDPNSVRFRNVGSTADILKAVTAKTVDAGLADVDVFGEQQKFGIHALADGLLWKEIPEYTNQANYASDEAIRNDREALVRVLAAYAKAYRFVSGPQSREAFLTAWRKVTGQSDVTEATTQWSWIQANQPYDARLLLSDAQIDLVQQVNVEFQAQASVLPVARIADMSLARDALKLLV
ncbi:MAG: ABC transporter substrate-binding protein [Steroidobacteraceae bacterium]